LSEVSEIFAALLKSGPDLIRLTLSLGWMYMTLGWRVRSTRRAFERELTRTGMSKEDAKRISAAFEELKNTILGTLKRGVFSGFSARL
jgi:hypothetical protein